MPVWKTSFEFCRPYQKDCKGKEVKPSIKSTWQALEAVVDEVRCLCSAASLPPPPGLID